MKELNIIQIAKGAKGKLHQGDPSRKVKRICKDSNKAGKEDLFVALEGERHDAHKFIPQALKRGCRCFMIAEGKAWDHFTEYWDANIILVEDTTTGLQELAAWYLEFLNIKKIAITGSTGKTSTRDLVYAVCSEKYHCEKNMGNLNNLIGVPMTILSFDEGTEVAIIEMGMDRLGEIKRLTEIVRPHIGIITNIGVAHIERLGSRENIFQAKMELVQGFGTENTLIINRQSPFLTRERAGGSYELITTGTEKSCDYLISHIDDFGIKGIQFTLEHKGVTERMKLNIPGRHSALNGALAVAAGEKLGISLKEAAAGLTKAELIRGRVSEKNGIQVIDDTYNASPDSMKSGIDTLVHSAAVRTVAILGDMYELGSLSRAQHTEVGRYAAAQGVDLLLAVGEASRYIVQGAEEQHQGIALYYRSKERLLSELRRLLQKGDLVLVKGSRGMVMEEIVKKIIEQ